MNALETSGTHAVKKTIVVNVSQARAYDVFVNRLASWWPLETHALGEKPARTATIEPAVGGRWFEIDKNGVECDWGRVVAIDPPQSIVLSWQISADFSHDPNIYTEVAVAFIPESDDRTLVELEHRGLEAYGDKALAMVELFDSPGAWMDGLERFRTAAES